MVYNDGYRPMLGQSKHPRALGAPGQEVWTEIWDVIEYMLDQVMAGGGATWSRDQMLVLDRNGYPEECYFTYSYSPITDESGGIGGVFCAVTETTERAIGERRLATLADLAGLMGSESRAEVLRTAGTVLGTNPGDHPVVLAVDTLSSWTASTSRPPSRPRFPRPQPPPAHDWPTSSARPGHRRVVRVPADEDAVAAGTSAWHAYPVVESGTPAHGRAGAVIVLGEAVTRRWDPALEAYATLCVTHVAAALTEVRELTEERRRRQALVELDEAKSAFFTNISHELRTPLTLISGPLQEALAVEEDEEQRHRLELVHHSARRLARMVDAMLDFGRMEAGRLEPQPTVVDVSQLARGLAESSVRRRSAQVSTSPTTATTASAACWTVTCSSGWCSTCCRTPSSTPRRARCGSSSAPSTTRSTSRCPTPGSASTPPTSTARSPASSAFPRPTARGRTRAPASGSPWSSSRRAHGWHGGPCAARSDAGAPSPFASPPPHRRRSTILTPRSAPASAAGRSRTSSARSDVGAAGSGLPRPVRSAGRRGRRLR